MNTTENECYDDVDGHGENDPEKLTQEITIDLINLTNFGAVKVKYQFLIFSHLVSLTHNFRL